MMRDESPDQELEEEEEEDPSFSAFFPKSFGKQSAVADVEAQINRTKRKISATEGISQHTIRQDENPQPTARSESDSEDMSDDDDEFPVSHELVLKTHERTITTATLDVSGSRLVTGSTDCTLKFHDFASMTPTTLRAFRSVDPTATKPSASSETHPIYQAMFNPLSAGHLLTITATPQARILSRDGELLAEFVKGDMYLRDMHNTKGHISEITSGMWHPTDRDICVTAGTDSTLRIWDINHKRSQKEVIVHKSRVAGSGGRTRMTAVAWGSPSLGGNNLLVGASLDGGLTIWSGNGPHSRPMAEVRDAHTRDTWTGGVDISADGRLIVTRGGDDMIKLWDTRKIKSPVTVVSHQSTSSQYPTSGISFSPNSSNIITGSQTGHLHILNSGSLKPELITPVTPDSPVISVLWHGKLNQIITGSANAEVHVLYSPKISYRGATSVMSKAPKRRHIDDDPNLTTDLSNGLSGDSVANSNGLLTGSNQDSTSYTARHPTVGLTASGRSRDPRRPNLPAQTPFAKSQPDEKHVKEHIPLSSMRDEDPREALLKYAELAEKDPIFTNAWKDTQPKTIYADVSDDGEDVEPDKKKIRR
ncbi:MAG: hypothetical protein M1829_001754 [Trizodia sp. TS-e1964]|nr:MAG: hypothetical protein M1829_001754 [Trizodia sp. TS-e1964]